MLTHTILAASGPIILGIFLGWVFNTFVKIILQAAIIPVVGVALGLRGELLVSAFLIGVIPTATAVPALTVGNKADEDKDDYKQDVLRQNANANFAGW